MSDLDLQVLDERIAALHSRYLFRFANKPRATRSVEELEGLLLEVEAARAELDALPSSPDLEAARARADQHLNLYREELRRVREARAKVPLVAEVGALAIEAGLLAARYRRHFAGRERTSRDPALLAELLERSRATLTQLESMPPEALAADHADLTLLRENVALFESELREIHRVQRAGSAEERAGRLGGLANAQFALYATHFAGKARTTRRAGLLARIIARLEQIGAQMQLIEDQGGAPAFNAQNLGIVLERLAFYTSEHAAIDAAHRGSSPTERIAALGNEVNAILERYDRDFAGQSRASRDAELLSSLCDELDEVAMQLRDLADDPALDHARAQLALVRDAQHSLEQEYELVVKARVQ